MEGVALFALWLGGVLMGVGGTILVIELWKRPTL